VDLNASASESQQTICLAGPQHSIRGRACGSSQLGNVVLRERDHDRRLASVQLHKVHKAKQHTTFDRDVKRLNQRRRQAAHFCDERARQHLVDPWPCRSEVLEVLTVQTQGFTGIEADRTPKSLARAKHCQLAEEIGGSEHPDHRLVTLRRRDANCKVAMDDQMQCVPGIAIMKYHLVAFETPASRYRENLPLLGVVKGVEQMRPHGTEYPISYADTVDLGPPRSCGASVKGSRAGVVRRQGVGYLYVSEAMSRSSLTGGVVGCLIGATYGN
jgi:hypothetical protein